MPDPATIAFAVKTALDILKGAKDAVALIPDPTERALKLAQVEMLQKQLNVKDAEIAKSFGYELCLAHAPVPGIMVDTGDEWKCTSEGCGRTKPTLQGQQKMLAECNKSIQRPRVQPRVQPRVFTPPGY